MARSNAEPVTSTGGLLAAPPMGTPGVELPLAGEKAPWATDPLSPHSLDLLRQFFALLDQWDRSEMTGGNGPVSPGDQLPTGNGANELALTLQTEYPETPGCHHD